MTQMPIQLIVGLGNPGKPYVDTRHNVGAWLLEGIADQYHIELRLDTKFHGYVGTLKGANPFPCHFLLPTTYMNESGRSVRAVARFYKIPPEAILILHDDLDFLPGTLRIKEDGGHGGHNGVRDIIKQLGTSHFLRVRIGIGHPGDRRRVHDYVLSPPSKSDHAKIVNAFYDLYPLLNQLLSGQVQETIKTLHTNQGSA